MSMCGSLTTRCALKRALKLYIEALDISERVALRASQHSREHVSTQASTQALKQALKHAQPGQPRDVYIVDLSVFTNYS